MEDVITLSSESDSDKEDSDVEIVGSYSNNMLTKADPLPLTEVRVDVDAVMNVKLPTPYIDLTDPRWTLPELKIRKRPSSTSLPLVDLTEWDITNGTKQDTENLPPDDNQKKNESIDHHTPNKEDFNLQRSSSIDPPGFALQQNCGNLDPNRSHMDFQIQQQSKTDEAEHHAPSVKLRRLSFLETHATELSSSGCPVYVTKDCTKMSLQPRQLGGNSEEPQCISHTASNGPHVEPSLHESSQVIEPPVRQHHASSNEFTSNQLEAETTPHVQRQSHSPCPDKGSPVANPTEHITHEDERSDLGSSIPIPSPTSPSSSQHKAQDSLQRDIVCSNLEHVESDQADSRQSCLPDPPAPEPPSTGPDPSELFNYDSWSHISPTSPNFESQVRSLSISEHTLTENTSEWQSEEFQADKASNRESIPRKSPSSVLETEDMDAGSGTGTYGGDLEFDNPLSYLWEEESDGERTNQESRFDTDFREVCREDRHFVCPAALRKIMSGPAQALVDDVDEGFGTPEVLCRQSLSLVYSTIDEKYPEGTLQLLSDLLQPGYYPPKDITSHLLHGIMLEPQCPYHLCVQAFNLLIRTQRHHMADRKTVPWNWELLTSVMSDQDDTKVYRSEVVRMLLEYIVQTLEDDFQAKLSTSSVHHSIAKAMLSCDQQFPRVRDVIKWLFSAIMKSTEPGENREAARERDEHVRMVSIFQRMLSLALEVDRSPALNSAKLSQELFHMLISSIPLRAHRMLLLESLQSKLLRCKLVEHLLDYACPVKVSLPMSLSLLLHFMKNCTLAPDPMDGAEMWQRWEELVHLLWMLLLSYNKAMNGYLCSSITEQKGRVGTMVYKQDDMVSKSAVLEAVESFLSRSQADLGQALPLHVEESLSYLQDHLLDVCQC